MIFGVVVAATIVPSCAVRAQRPIPPESAAVFLALPAEGVEAWPVTIRRRVTGDRSTLDVYAALLNGTPLRYPRSPKGATKLDSATAMWWLAESGDPRFVPLFLRYSSTAPSGPWERFRFSAATFGLARTASIGAAANQLRMLARRDAASRNITVGALLAVNDTVSRSLLREIPPATLTPRQQERVRAVLTPP